MNSYRKDYDISKMEDYKGKHGYVYFLKEYHGNTVKIGHAKDPEQRINQMIFVPSIPVEIIHTIRSKNAQRLERLFHHYFYKKRIEVGLRTEFFVLSEHDMEKIYKRNLPEEIISLIIEEEYELPPRLRRLEWKKSLE
ncbi:GIY-YIG nuclease family protein [Oceanobacillus profundus]|uniref:GIY-YIG nuclease family protein n=1 Tax=Oceanobacillus profundus TaxID=372463 RepID=UPI00362F2198